MRQLSFLPKASKEHGGDTRKGRRKIQRPFDPKRPLHLTLKSSRARGALSLLSPSRKGHVLELAHAIAARHDVRVYRFANVGSHLHLLVQARTRTSFQSFLREFAGRIAILVTGAIKGRPAKFWDGLVWTKIVEWGRQFQHAARYILLNFLEAGGHRDRELLARLERDGIAFARPDS